MLAAGVGTAWTATPKLPLYDDIDLIEITMEMGWPETQKTM